MTDEILNKPRWFQTWWGASLIGVAVFLSFSVLVFGVLFGAFLLKSKDGATTQFFKNFPASQQKESGGVASLKRQAIESANEPFAGNPKAEVVIVEFVDYKCPNSKAVAPVMKKVMEKYGYKIKLIIRDMPADYQGGTIRAGATDLAVLANCAAEQGRFWEMYYLLFDNQDNLPVKLSDREINFLADSAGTDVTALKKCMSGTGARFEAGLDFSDAIKYGAKGTPTFFINGEKLDIVPDFEGWEQILKNL